MMGRTHLARRRACALVALVALLPLLVRVPAEAATTSWLNPTRFGARCDGVHDDTSAFQAAIDAVVTGSRRVFGGIVSVPAGTCMISRKLLVKGSVVLRGEGADLSRIKALPSFTRGRGDAMLELGNGNGDKWDYAFNSRVEDVTVDANDVAGLSGVWSEQANEGGGMQRAAVVNFRRYGFFGAAGASSVMVAETLFRGSEMGMEAGIRLRAWGANAVKDCVVVGPSNGSGDGVRATTTSVVIENLQVDRVTRGVTSTNPYGDGAILGITGGPAVRHLIDATAGASWFIRDAVAGGSTATLVTSTGTRTGDIAQATS